MEENKKQRIYKTIMLIVVVALITFVTTVVLTYNGTMQYIVQSTTMPNNEVAKKIDVLLSTVTELLKEKYIGEINEEALIDGALAGLVDSVGDTYTTYFSKKELDEFTEQTLGNFVGIGIYMQANVKENLVEIVSPIKGSPAEQAGLKKGDFILKVDGVEYTALDMETLSSKIKGEEGTEVTLTIRRKEEVFEVTVKRANVHINYVTSEMLEDNIGYIALATFDEGCTEDFKTEYNNLVAQGAKSLIIDLRDNGGGLVDEALAIADLMCEKDEITLIKVDKDGTETITRSETEREITMPVVVITNGASASASEILVAALQDNKKATIVGDKTYGKGVIQELIYLSNGGALKVTSSEYYTPNKKKINEVRNISRL